MSITLKRQITEEEKKIVISRHDRLCFATGHKIPEGETIHFDHIKAFIEGGLSDLNNIAPMCQTHNLKKGRLTLEDFRTKLRLEEFFSGDQKLTLRHLLGFLKKADDIKTFGESVSVSFTGNKVKIQCTDKNYDAEIYKCPTTGWEYFYLTLDVDVINSDDDNDDIQGLQPRYLMIDKVFKLFRHFQQHPVLQPAIGRIDDNQIRLFDGQHKIAGLLLNRQTKFECKIYLDADLRLLNLTNITAHDRFSQTRFTTSVMIDKLGHMFGKDFDEYKNEETNEIMSEAGFVRYLLKSDGLTMTKGEINKRFRSYLYVSALDHEDNKLRPLISSGNRSTDEHPITMDMLEKSLFSALMYRQPTSDDLTTDAYKTDHETNNVVAIMNMFHEFGLSEWNADAAPNDDNRLRLSRLLRSKSTMAWSEIFHDAVCGKIDLNDTDERERPLYRELTDAQLHGIKSIVQRLMDWQGWSAPASSEIDRIFADNKSEVKKWFREKRYGKRIFIGGRFIKNNLLSTKP